MNLTFKSEDKIPVDLKASSILAVLTVCLNCI